MKLANEGRNAMGFTCSLELVEIWGRIQAKADVCVKTHLSASFK